MSYRIKLENFEGPLDLLLYFIRRDELDIYDIPISKITKDFIAVIEEWKKLNMVVAGDFIVMASTLMRVKAKMMIPANRMTMIQLVDAGVPIETLTRTITFTGFTQGKFTPDIAELLNPVVAGFIAIQADKAGITPRMLNNPPKTSIDFTTEFL